MSKEDKTRLADPIAPLAAEARSTTIIDRESLRATDMVVSVRARADEMREKAELVEKIYIGEFLEDAALANQLATALVAGRMDEVAFDAQSLGEHGDNPAAVREYLSAFQAVDPTATYPFPTLTFPTTAIIDYNGQEHHVSRYGGYNPLDAFYFSPSFTPDITLPTLIDPTPRTFAELHELEKLD